MKSITFILFLISAMSMAQIKGNKRIVTKTFSVEGLVTIRINLYAQITIDQSLEEGLQITTDSNLFEQIAKSVEDGVLHLDQIQWISPSEAIQITIGAPNLKRIEQSTHETTKIINVKNDYLEVMASVGQIFIQGVTKELRLGSELAVIDALKLQANIVFVNLWSSGKVIVDSKTSLWARVSDGGTLVYLKKPAKYNVSKKRYGKVLAYQNNVNPKNPKATFIAFKIKNNSGNRHNFYVVGPKPDGSKFSYGFPMMPHAKRQENWTIGTRVYKVNQFGFRKLLTTITKEDEATVVDLF